MCAGAGKLLEHKMLLHGTTELALHRVSNGWFDCIAAPAAAKVAWEDELSIECADAEVRFGCANTAVVGRGHSRLDAVPGLNWRGWPDFC